MKVKCIRSKGSQIPSYIYNGFYGYSKDTVFAMEIGETSIVYAIVTIRGYLWYLVYPPNYTYVLYQPAALFDITDGRLSKYWSIANAKDEKDLSKRGLVFGFPELISNEYLFGEYINDDPKSIEIMEKYIELMNKEFGYA